MSFAEGKRYEDIMFTLEAMCRSTKHSTLKDSFFTYRKVANSNVTSTVGADAMLDVFGDRYISISREISKLHESVFVGFILGIFCGYSEFFNSFLKIPLAIIRVTPVISVILLILFWFKSGTVPIVTSVLMSLPIMITSIHKGFSKIDNSLLQMAKVFNLTKIQVFKNIVLKSITPFFWNGVLSTFGLSWKVVIASEVLSLPAKSVGTILQKSQLHLEAQEVFAITIIIVCISFIFERLLDFFIKKTFGKNYENGTK